MGIPDAGSCGLRGLDKSGELSSILIQGDLRDRDRHSGANHKQFLSPCAREAPIQFSNVCRQGTVQGRSLHIRAVNDFAIVHAQR